jgi:hypothetical protein
MSNKKSFIWTKDVHFFLYHVTISLQDITMINQPIALELHESFHVENHSSELVLP